MLSFLLAADKTFRRDFEVDKNTFLLLIDYNKTLKPDHRNIE